MGLSEVAVVLLLLVALGAGLVSAVGLVAMSNVFDRLHYLGPASTISPMAVAAAILIDEGLGAASIKSILAAVVLVSTGPVLAHATARAARIRQFGHWAAMEHEKVRA